MQKKLNIFEKYLTLWVMLCIGAGILLGKLAPGVAVTLDSLSVFQVSIPIAVALFFMMYPIMVKIDFKEVIKSGETVELWRSYISGTILLGIAPCTAMVLMWFQNKFLHYLSPVSIIALLTTLVLLFSFKGDKIIENPLTIVWIAIPLFIKTLLIFMIGYFVFSRLLKLRYEDAAPASMIGASNNFEVALATSTMLFGLASGASLATVVGVLIEVHVMLMLVRICKKSCGIFNECALNEAQCKKIPQKQIAE